MSEKNISTLEGAAMIAGTGIGSGVMAIPYLFHHSGIIGGIIALGSAYVISMLLHFFVADIMLNTRTNEIATAISGLIITGKRKKIIRYILLSFVVIMIIANLCSYILGGAEILTSVFNINSFPAKIIFCISAIIPTLFGLKVIGNGEKYLIGIISGLVIYFFVISVCHPAGSISLAGRFSFVIETFSMTMFSMTAIFAVPQLVSGLNYDKKKIKTSIIGGLSLNLAVCVLICISTIAASRNVTKMAAVGWSESFGSTFKILSGIFILLAMLTSFFVLAYSLASIISKWFKIKPALCFTISTLPSLLMSFIPFASFTKVTKLASGIISLLIAILIIPSYYKSVKITNASPIIGRYRRHYIIYIATLAGIILMTIGSLIEV